MDTMRIQRKRTKGWRMPEGAVYVGRGSKWGNPYPVGDTYSREEAVELYRQHIAPRRSEVVAELKGKPLACWCSPQVACHGDVLVELCEGE